MEASPGAGGALGEVLSLLRAVSHLSAKDELVKILPIGPAARVAVTVVALGICSESLAQVFVYPRRPHKSQVRHFEFDWRHIDIMVGPDAGPEARDEGPRAPYDQLRFLPGSDDGTAIGFPSLHETGRLSAHGAGSSIRFPGAWRGSLLRSGGGEASEAQPSLRPKGANPALESNESEEPLSTEEEEGLDAHEAGGLEGDELVVDEQPTSEEVLGLEPGPNGQPLDPGVPSDIVPPHAPPGETDPVPPPVVGVDPDPTVEDRLPSNVGGVRLFFYEDARDIAEKAAAIIKSQYLFLIEEFDYVPTRTFPYILYSSYQEFLQTNLFPLQEGVLGVTSPRDLKLSLPYFGDHRLFSEVSLHELVHQFTIQKVRTFAERAEVWGEPLEAMPLWFIEGIAEYYAKQGLDHETEMLVRDIVVNPDFMRGYVMLDFHDDRPWSALWTYKVGQARATFLEETYGEGTLQRILERSPLLIGAIGDEKQARSFAALLERLTGDAPEVMSSRFSDWIKRRSFETYLSAEQAAPQLRPLNGVRGRANALTASPDGNLLAYRSLDYETGRTRIILVDRRDRGSSMMLVGDAVPGVESLHPIQVRNFDLSDDRVAFIAQANGRDLIYVQALERRVRTLPDEERSTESASPAPIGQPMAPGEPAPAPEVVTNDVGDGQRDAHDVRIRTGRRVAYDPAEQGIIAAFSPALEPGGERVAFVGLSSDGIKNVYVLEPTAGGHSVRKLTDDPFAQRQISWGPDGIVFTSDGTDDGRYNIFSVSPESGEISRVTSEARDHFDPRALPDGRVMFTAYNNGRADIHEALEGEVIRRTDIETGLFDVAPGPDGGLWALFHVSGQRTPALIASDQLLAAETTRQSVPGDPRLLPRMSLIDDEEYRALALSNWELGNIFGFFGAGGGGLFGQLMATASDRLRDHVLVLNLFVFGSFELTDGYLLYINQQRRTTWGAGPFQSLRFRRDETFDDLPVAFRSGERFFGGMLSLRYPFNRFVYLQGDLNLGGVTYFLSADARDLLRNPQANLTGHDLLPEWEARRGGVRFQTEASARIGYDTIRYHPGTGPLAGSSAMLEGTLALQPFDDELFGNVRLDGERYFPLIGRTHFFLRGGAGASFGGRLTRQFFLSSWDTIRGVEFGDDDWLLGKHFFFSTAELQFPLNAIIRLVLFTDIEGVLGLDFGGVADDLGEIFDKRVLNLVTGLNFGFGPLVFKLHFARPLDTGAPAGLPTDKNWVTNFSLGWLYF